MAVKIGHSSCDENGKAHGGKAGDSTSKEVCVRTWYDGKWHTVLRAKSETVAEKMAIACEAGCANSNIGYDQYQRNTLRTQAKAVNFNLEKITVPCECDCSSFMAVCAECASVNVPYDGSNAPTTRTMVNAFKSTGCFEVLRDSKYLTSDAYLKRGDVLVKDGHTVMVLENGSKFVSREAVATITIKVPPLKRGCKYEAVRALQAVLNLRGYDCGEPDGSFGPKTETAVKAFQKAKGLDVDGIVGTDTWTVLLNG